MSTHKNIDKICVAFMVLALIITVVFMNGEKLGITAIHDEDSETYEDSYGESEYFTKNDMNGSWDTTDATKIILSDDGISINGSGAYVNGKSLVIAMSGEYVISGELTDGSINVDANNNSKVFIMFDGVSINCSDNAAFTIGEADKVFLTLNEGSVNTLSSGAEYSEEAIADGAGGVIYAHDDLTINGTGELNIIAGYKHGIEANDDLTITGGKITITDAPKDGITVNEKFEMCNADLTIAVEDDAVHADGSIYIESGTILINSCYEGLEAPYIDIAGGDITVYPEDDALNASDGSGGGFMMMAPSAMGNMAGDDNGKTGDKTDEAEAKAEKDGDAEESKEEDSEEDAIPYVHITGGKLKIINENAQDADGIDSNGDIIIDGGDIFINLKGSGTNNALDYGSESGGICEINGGTVIACGAYNMAESADATSKQVSIMYTISSGIEAGETVRLEDTDENAIMEFTLECSATCLILSCPELKVGETYLFATGDNVDEISVEEVSATYGDSQSSMFGGKMNFGNMMGREDFRSKRNSFGGEGGGHGHGGEKGPGENHGDKNGNGGENVSGSESGPGGPGEDGTDAASGSEMPPMPTQVPDMPDGEAPEGVEDMTPPDMPDGEAPEGMEMSGDMGQGGPMGMPGMENAAQEEEEETGHSITEYDLNTWLIYGGCFALAIAGVIIAAAYKRRRY